MKTTFHLEALSQALGAYTGGSLHRALWMLRLSQRIYKCALLHSQEVMIVANDATVKGGECFALLKPESLRQLLYPLLTAGLLAGTYYPITVKKHVRA